MGKPTTPATESTPPEKKYSVAFKKSALKELENLPRQVVGRIAAAIEKLGDDPRPTGCKKLKGYENLWRIRIGDYRVLYSIEDDVLTVEILEVVNREDAY